MPSEQIKIKTYENMYDHIESMGAVRVLRIAVINTPPALMMIISSSRTSEFFAAIESSIVFFSVWSFTVSSSNRCILFRCFACNCSHNIVISSSLSSMELRSFDVTNDASDLLRFDMVDGFFQIISDKSSKNKKDEIIKDYGKKPE